MKDPTHGRFLARTAIPEPDLQWAQWKNSWQHYWDRCDSRIEKERNQNDLFRDLVEHKKKLGTLFPAFTRTPVETTLGPGDFHISETLVFRDWIWGWETELKPALDRYTDSLSPKTDDIVIVVGSGAGRLAFEWAAKHPHHHIHSVDNSPFFCQIQAALALGSELKLLEVSRVAHDFEARGVERRFRWNSEFKPQVWWASALKLPFSDSTADRIVSHWVIDVLAAPLETVFVEWNRVLKTGGAVQIEGPLSFESVRTPQYSPRRIEKLLKESGFKVQTQATLEVPYLQSPLEADRRTQKVWRAMAIKEQSLQPTKLRPPPSETDLEQLRPRLKSLAQKLEAQTDLLKSLETQSTWSEWENHWIQKGVPAQLLPALKRQILDELSR